MKYAKAICEIRADVVLQVTGIHCPGWRRHRLQVSLGGHTCMTKGRKDWKKSTICARIFWHSFAHQCMQFYEQASAAVAPECWGKGYMALGVSDWCTTVSGCFSNVWRLLYVRASIIHSCNCRHLIVTLWTLFVSKTAKVDCVNFVHFLSL